MKDVAGFNIRTAKSDGGPYRGRNAIGNPLTSPLVASRSGMKLKKHKYKKHKTHKPKPQGKGIVKALGQKGTTGNFKRIEKAKGKGAAIGALQNKLAKRRGKPVPYHR